MENLTVIELKQKCKSLNIKLSKSDGTPKLKKDLIKSLSSSKSTNLINGGARKSSRKTSKKTSKRRGSRRGKSSKKTSKRRGSRKSSKRRVSRKSSKRCGSRKSSKRRGSRKRVSRKTIRKSSLKGGNNIRLGDNQVGGTEPNKRLHFYKELHSHMTNQEVNFDLYFNKTQESYQNNLTRYAEDQHINLYLSMFHNLKNTPDNSHQSNPEMERNDDYQRLEKLIYKPKNTLAGHFNQINKKNLENLERDKKNLKIAFQILQSDKNAKENKQIKLDRGVKNRESSQSMVFYIPEDDLINKIHLLNGFYELQDDKLVNSEPYWKGTKTINSNGDFVDYTVAPEDDLDFYMYYKIEGPEGKPYLCISSNSIFNFTVAQEEKLEKLGTSSVWWSDFVEKLEELRRMYPKFGWIIQKQFNKNHAGYAYIYWDSDGFWKQLKNMYANSNIIIEFKNDQYFMDKKDIFYGTEEEYLAKKQDLNERKTQSDEKQAAEKKLEEAKKAKQDEEKAD